MPEPNPFYAMQPAFTGGEVSDEVASRVDLDKYQLALLQAENAIIRPYGPVYKRPGSLYCGLLRDARREVLLYRFAFAVDVSYLLEWGHGYLRIWRDGVRLPVELDTPFLEGDLKHLRFVQSVDVMYICSGRHPVQRLARYTEADWRLTQAFWQYPAFGDVNTDEGARIAPSGRMGQVELSADKDVFSPDRVGDVMKLEQYVNGETVSVSATPSNGSYTSQQLSAPAGTQVTIRKSGQGACRLTLAVYYRFRRSLFHKEGYAWEDVWAKESADPFEGQVELSAKVGEKGHYLGVFVVRVDGVQGAPKVEVTLPDGTRRVFHLDDKSLYSAAVTVGKAWKVTTHGSWSGQMAVQLSTDDGATWVDLRTYTSSEDYNATESGDVDAYALLRIRARVTGGRCNADLSAYPYRHEGVVTITGVADAQHASARVDKVLGGVEATADWYWAAWSRTNGYPRCAAFFQDRLCFGGCKRYPQRLWMSRSGDYENFSVTKEQGVVTDDSAVTVDLLSRQAFQINHLDVGNDLVVFTDGNTWTIAGAETVKPTNVTPKNQENYGCSDVPPLRVGNRVVYVQRRAAVIRDTGYSYESDGYVGQDLTLLAKHLMRGREVVSAAYAQEPDSLLYFVRDDGVLLCLTYVMEQKVFAWSHFVTDGKYKAVCAVNEGSRDRVYVVVERTLGARSVRTLERFAHMPASPHQQDYVMADAAFAQVYDAPQKDLPGKHVLMDREVVVLADGYFYEHERMTEDSSLPVAARTVTVGLPYKMVIEQPNFDAGNTPSGTVQGRQKLVSTAILRLTHSFGGAIGPNAALQNAIVYDDERMELGEDVLYTGDKQVTLPAGGWDTRGRTCITHDTPYPFSLSAIIREVSFGG